MFSLTQKKINWQMVCVVSFVLILVTCIPYAYGYFSRPDGHTYSGIDFLTPGDTNTYLSMIEQVKQGHWSFVNLYTSEEHPRVYVHLLWLLIGLMAKIFSLSPLVAFHVARILLIFAFVYVIVRILHYLFGGDNRKIILALLLICFASGVGIFVDGFLHNPPESIQHPVDTWVPEAIPFLSMMHSPHYIASTALLLFSLYWIMRAFLERRYRFATYAGMCAALLIATHPFYVPTLYAVAGVWALYVFVKNMRQNYQVGILYLIYFAISAPVMVYFLWLNNISIVFHQWSAANDLASPSPWMYVFGFGLVIPFAIYGAYRSWLDTKLRFVIYWVLVNIVLLYTPFTFQRRLVEGLFVPLAILATVGIYQIYMTIRKRSWRVAVAYIMVLAVFLPLGNIQLISQDLFFYSDPNNRYYYYYYPPTGEIEAFEWLKNNTDESAIVLSSSEVGNFLPAYSGRRVFVGHNPQSIYFGLKVSLAERFFGSETSEDAKKAFLDEWNISYVVYADRDKQYRGFVEPEGAYLEKVFSTNAATVYRVVD